MLVLAGGSDRSDIEWLAGKARQLLSAPGHLEMMQAAFGKRQADCLVDRQTAPALELASQKLRVVGRLASGPVKCRDGQT